MGGNQALQVLDNEPRFFRNRGDRRAAYVMVGPTFGGRLLVVPIEDWGHAIWRPVTAFDANESHALDIRRRFERDAGSGRRRATGQAGRGSDPRNGRCCRRGSNAKGSVGASQRVCQVAWEDRLGRNARGGRAPGGRHSQPWLLREWCPRRRPTGHPWFAFPRWKQPDPREPGSNSTVGQVARAQQELGSRSDRARLVDGQQRAQPWRRAPCG